MPIDVSGPQARARCEFRCVVLVPALGWGHEAGHGWQIRATLSLELVFQPTYVMGCLVVAQGYRFFKFLGVHTLHVCLLCFNARSPHTCIHELCVCEQHTHACTQ